MRRVWWENAPGNKVLDVVAFEGPDVLAEFGGVSVSHVAEWCGVVSVSCFRTLELKCILNGIIRSYGEIM